MISPSSSPSYPLKLFALLLVPKFLVPCAAYIEWPQDPDTIACDSNYGEHLIESDCLTALSYMSASNMNHTYGRADSEAHRDFTVPLSYVDSEST